MDLTERAARAGVELVGVEGELRGSWAAGHGRAFYQVTDGVRGQALALAASLLLRSGQAPDEAAVASLAASFLPGE